MEGSPHGRVLRPHETGSDSTNPGQRPRAAMLAATQGPLLLSGPCTPAKTAFQGTPHAQRKGALPACRRGAPLALKHSGMLTLRLRNCSSRLSHVSNECQLVDPGAARCPRDRSAGLLPRKHEARQRSRMCTERVVCELVIEALERTIKSARDDTRMNFSHTHQAKSSQPRRTAHHAHIHINTQTNGRTRQLVAAPAHEHAHLDAYASHIVANSART